MLSIVRRRIKPVINRMMPAASIHASPDDDHDDAVLDRKRLIISVLPPPKSPLEYEGNLEDGIALYKYMFPPTWSLDDEVERRKIYSLWGAWVPPTDADIHRFFNINLRKVAPRSTRYTLFDLRSFKMCQINLIPYFREMRKSWGFDEVSFADRESFPTGKIQPAHEVVGGTADDYTTGIRPPFDDLTACDLDCPKWRVRLSFIRAVQYLTEITGHKHEPVEIVRVNIYPSVSLHLYLTFIARNLSTGLSQTFQAVVRDAGVGYSFDVFYIRLKPTSM
ncbi:hypothetical protein Tsubulata_024134 [Turnera subulata]|uniref:Uncharacterized protein n=1 Tax=Turnera subulata TaxID=218843 RepID=A0A9Q0FU23_9ROSI|nr:hypothetical protein Tsubulata_024134 [Turnera subulata]